MRVINTNDKAFEGVLAGILGRGEADTSAVEEAVKRILSDVKRDGDSAVVEYTRRFDGADVEGALLVTEKEINSALRKIPKSDLSIIELSASRIEAFHKRQIQQSWFTTEEDGTILGSRVTPIERAGIYVPGGKATYPSTVLMNAIPAKVAGVSEVIMVTPPGKDGISPYVLAAAKVAGVDKVFRIGGAHSIGALAFGTATVPKVDKITGPGNIYVATAKRLVFGTVDIDMIAGPSEILIINDGTGSAEWMALDLLSQAEHDELASSILITTSKKTASKVAVEVKRLVKKLKRRAIAEKSIERYGAIIVARDLVEAAEISNRIAPEHLELFVEDPFGLMGLIKNAGAIFLGHNTPEAAGDYLAGPNHTLPTGGTARFSSPLGVSDFIKRTSVISLSPSAIRTLGPSVKRFAELEGLEAHGLSAGVRLSKRGR
ncbi:MAG: histidinol dehydrogenase [Deltaproteobacteria bacterium GWB2_55_19]|nr:MAG: histidinol dehydrogenase [Deltaproteobacteria bacterium GWB2_55_19]HAO94067.1 histidinol dehydrogenase [Deltaproteobacteria bacterium]